MSLNVLVVDDSSVARSMIKKILGLSGIPLGEVYQASNGKEGLEQLEANWIDIIFVDINMPVMNGEEMLEAVRASETWKDLPVVVVSTEGSKTRVERFEHMGAKFIHKPFSPEIVREVVLEITGVSHEQQPDTSAGTSF